MKKILLSDFGDIRTTPSLCKKYNLGVDAGSFCFYDFYPPDSEIINKHLTSYKNIEIYSIHGPIADLIFESNVITEAKTRFEYAYNILPKLNCKNMILHNGYVSETSLPENWIKNAGTFWKNYLKNKDNGTNFYIENYMETSPDIILDLINDVNKNNFKMCLDTGHVNIFSDIKITEWIEKANKNIGFVHLHNNGGKKDDHNALNNGTINMLDVCKTLEQYSPDAIWALETTYLEESVEWLKKNNFL